MIDKSAVKAKGSPQLMRRAVRVSPIAVLTAIVAACGGDGSDHDTFSTRDSAGVKIVESMEALWAEGEGWRLSAEPSLTIGVDEGPEEYSLFQVGAALRLPNGNIVIANRGTAELRYYDSSGSYLRSVGGAGYGPGEFKWIWAVWLVDDTLVVSDWEQARVSLFSETGDYGRTLMLQRDPDELAPRAVGVFSDGSILGNTLVFDIEAASGNRLQLITTRALYRRYSRDGAVLDSLGVFPLNESVGVTLDRERDAGSSVSRSRMAGTDTPFSPAGWWTAFGEQFYYGWSESYEIDVFCMDGTLERIIRRLITNPPVTSSDIEAYKQDFVDEGDPSNLAWKRRLVDDLSFPDTKPAHGRLKVDALGHLWVEDYTWLDEDTPRTWTVFETEGRMLGPVQVPGNGHISEIGNDYLLGVWRTELGVEQVKMYRILKD